MSTPARPFFSVILPTCDRPNDLSNALLSLKRQTYEAFEVLVVNDGHADVTPILNEMNLEERDIPIRNIDSGTRTGPSAARNKGLKQAQGEIIAYLDDDDVFHPNHLAIHAACYMESSAPVVYSDANRCILNRNADGTITTDTRCVHSQDFDPDLLLVQNYIPMLCLTHRTQCLEETGGFDESLSSLVDWDLFIRLSADNNFQHIPEVTGTYFEKGLGESVQERNRMNFLGNLDTIYAKTEAMLRGDAVRRDAIWSMRLSHVARMMYDTGLHFELQNDHAEALRAFSRAAEMKPKADYYMGIARSQKALGNRGESLIATQLARHCLNEATNN